MLRNLPSFAMAALACLTAGASAGLAQCNLAVSPAALLVDSTGGAGVLQVTTAPIQSGTGAVNCTFSTYSTKPWIAITGTILNGQDSSALSGNVPAGIKYSIQANANAGALTGAIVVANNSTSYVIPVLLRGVGTGQTFDDVPMNHPQFDYIAMLSRLAITRGCSATPSLFCPDQVTTRGQAAAFIVRSLLGENFTFNPTPAFTDVPSTHPQFSYIQKMKELNITQGCSASPAKYCPEDPVLREQMATLLVRARYPSYSFSSTPYFSDVPGPGSQTPNPHFQTIQKLREGGITIGCSVNPPLYCPTQTVTRAQMAAFIIRAFFTN